MGVAVGVSSEAETGASVFSIKTVLTVAVIRIRFFMVNNSLVHYSKLDISF